MKFTTKRGRICTIKGDQTTTRSCYHIRLDVPKGESDGPLKESGKGALTATWDARDESGPTRPEPEGETFSFQIGVEKGQTVRISSGLTPGEREDLTSYLLKNKDLFAWTLSNMPGIDPSFICHKLAVDFQTKPVAQRRRKIGVERQEAVLNQARDMLKARIIKEITYTT